MWQVSVEGRGRGRGRGKEEVGGRWCGRRRGRGMEREQKRGRQREKEGKGGASYLRVRGESRVTGRLDIERACGVGRQAQNQSVI